MNIVFLDASTLGEVPNLRKLEKYGVVHYYSATKKDEIISRVKNAEVIITNKVPVDKEVIKSAAGLKLICVAATGTNNVDLDYAEQRKIPVKNAVGYSTKSVAQAAFCGLLALLHQTEYYNRYVQSGKYCDSDIFTHINHNFWELSGKTFGIVGLGNIGKQVAKVAEAFGVNVIYFSTSGSNFNSEYKRVDFSVLLQQSDVVSIHAPLNNHTAGLFGRKEFLQMKKSAILINMGRGGIVNEKELATAIDENLIWGSVLDVFGTEPMDKNNPLLQIKKKERLLLTPHIAWASIEARTKLIDIVCEHLENWVSYC